MGFKVKSVLHRKTRLQISECGTENGINYVNNKNRGERKQSIVKCKMLITFFLNCTQKYKAYEYTLILLTTIF